MKARAVLCLWLASLLGCDTLTEQSGHVGDVRRDSAGIAIIENQRPRFSTWRVAGEPILSIGDRAGGVENELYQVRDAVMLSNGSVVVANAGTSEVRWYSQSGELLHRAGREGDGPGEFRFLSDLMILPNDSVAAYDVMAQRFTIFGPEAGFAEGVPIHALPVGLVPVARMQDGSYVMATGGLFRAGAIGPTRVARDTIRVYRSVAGQLDSILILPGIEIVIAPTGRLTRTGEPAFSRSPRPFGLNGAITGTQSGLVTGDTGSYELHFRASSGSLESIARWNGHTRTVTDADLTADQEHRLSSQRDPDTRIRLRTLWEQHPAPPDRMPAFATPLVPDETGNVWVKRYAPPAEGGSNIFDVIDTNGIWLATVPVPEGLRVLSVIRDRLLGIRTDALGIESVAVYEVLK